MVSRTITIHLTKDDVEQYEDALKEPELFGQIEPRIESEGEPALFVNPHPAKPPRWLVLLREGFDLAGFDMRVKSSAAVLFLTANERIFAITFGQGRSMLDEGRFVEDFGLKASLSAISPDELRNVDVMRPETSALRKRQQTGRSSRMDEFEIDHLIDVIRSITGKSADEDIAKKLTGSNALKLSADVGFLNLHAKCSEALNLYGSDAYRENFSMIDQMRPVRDPLITSELDEILIRALNEDDLDRVYLSPPEIIDETEIAGFKFQGTRDRTIYTDLDIADYIVGRAAEEPIELRTLKNHRVQIQFEAEGVAFPRWSIFKCIIFETVHNEHQYILTEGSWYRIDGDFRDRVLVFFDEHLIDGEMPNANDQEHEPDYLRRVSERENLILMDQHRFNIPNENTAYEACDLLTTERQLIHTKPSKKGSSTLSHLFRQGVMAGEFLIREPEFRRQIREDLALHAPEHIDLIPQDEFNPRDYTVRFGVIARRRRDGNFDIPFFSKVSFQHAARRLSSYGYNVDICFIERNR